MANPTLKNTLGKPQPKAIKPPKQFLPKGIQRAYGTAIIKLLAPFFNDVRERLLPMLPTILTMAADELKADAYGDLISKTIGGIEIGTGIFIPPSSTAATALNAGIATSNQNRKQVDKQVRAVLGVDPLRTERYLAPAMDAFVKQNTALITTIAPDYLKKVDFIVRDGALRGESLKTVTSKIVLATKSSNTRARLIARDQVGKFNGQLTMLRQQEVGVREYFWDTQGNERVRGNPTGKYPNAVPSHWDRQGKRFSWKKPPEGGHPGQAIQCQCVAIPIFSEAEAVEIAPDLQHVNKTVPVAPVIPPVAPAVPDVVVAPIKTISELPPVVKPTMGNFTDAQLLEMNDAAFGNAFLKVAASNTEGAGTTLTAAVTQGTVTQVEVTRLRKVWQRDRLNKRKERAYFIALDRKRRGAVVTKQVVEEVNNAYNAGSAVDELIRRVGLGKEKTALQFQIKKTSKIKMVGTEIETRINKVMDMYASMGHKWKVKHKVVFDMDGTRRAFHRQSTRRIMLGNRAGGTGIPTIVHEMGHHFEQNVPRLRQKAEKFLARRTKGEKLVPLNSLPGKSGYGADEMTWPDKFKNPYTGKRYYGSTEVISMGMEQMLVDPVAFANSDRDFFDFIIGVMRHGR